MCGSFIALTSSESVRVIQRLFWVVADKCWSTLQGEFEQLSIVNILKEILGVHGEQLIVVLKRMPLTTLHSSVFLQVWIIFSHPRHFFLFFGLFSNPWRLVSCLLQTYIFWWILGDKI